MKILMLVNWKVKYCSRELTDKQPPDYNVKGESYWFYRYFREQPEVDVIDTSSFWWLERFERNKLRFYLFQAFRAIPKLNQYDLIVSHGMQSGVVISLWRRLFKGTAKHIVFDIGSFASASESGFALKLMQFASKSIDGVIYHTSSQIDYYKKLFPWIIEKSKFMRFGTDLNFFNPDELVKNDEYGKYIICVGYSKRDWNTVVQAYQQLDTDIKLRLVGHVEDKFKGIKGVEQVPFVPIKNLINQIYNAKFSVLPLESFNYSYGQMTLMQQMALGKCVIAAKVPSLMDYMQNWKTVIYYEPKSVKELKEKLEFLLNNSELINKIGEQAIDYLNTSCNEKIMALEIEKMMNLVCKV